MLSVKVPFLPCAGFKSSESIHTSYVPSLAPVKSLNAGCLSCWCIEIHPLRHSFEFDEVDFSFKESNKMLIWKVDGVTGPNGPMQEAQ